MKALEYITLLIESPSDSHFKKRMMQITKLYPESWGGITAENVSDNLPYSFTNGTFIHFTRKNPDWIIENGFRGVRYMDNLVNMPKNNDSIDIGEEVIFAYNIDFLDANHFYSALKTYGKNAIIFQAFDVLSIFSPIDGDFEELVAINNIQNPIAFHNISREKFIQIRNNLETK